MSMNNEIKKNKKRFRISRWIFLSLAVLTNTFLVLYSTLPREITIRWNNFFTSLFAGLINSITEKEVIPVPMTELEIKLSDEETYKYNYIPGYEVDEIPLGSAKQVECTYLPLNTTDKSVQYYTEQNDIIKLNQSGTTVSVVGMKPGIAKIHAKNTLSELDASCIVKVVETVEPEMFNISISSNEIPIGSQQTIDIDINGGYLGHDELINFRYYDTRKLTYTSSIENVCTVDEYGVIYPHNIGDSVITVSNTLGHAKSIQVSVVDGVKKEPYSNLSIYGSSFCYDNDMIKDQDSRSNHYQLGVKDGDIELDPEDFIWESSNELLAKIDMHGVLRGFRKSVVDDEQVTITATSKLTGQSVTYEIVVKEQLPEELYYWIINNDKTTWNPTEYTACVGDNLIINTSYSPDISKKDITAIVSDESVIECTNQGSSLSLIIKNTGSCLITITSVINPSLSKTISFSLLKAGAISTNDLDDVGVSVRKVVGHASLFAIAELFTLIALCMFLYKKKFWLPIVISLGIEFFVSSISELVQYFTPDRHGTFVDILINMAGAVFVVLIALSIYFIRKMIKNRKNKLRE